MDAMYLSCAVGRHPRMQRSCCPLASEDAAILQEFDVADISEFDHQATAAGDKYLRPGLAFGFLWAWEVSVASDIQVSIGLCPAVSERRRSKAHASWRLLRLQSILALYSFSCCLHCVSRVSGVVPTAEKPVESSQARRKARSHWNR